MSSTFHSRQPSNDPIPFQVTLVVLQHAILVKQCLGRGTGGFLEQISGHVKHPLGQISSKFWRFKIKIHLRFELGYIFEVFWGLGEMFCQGKLATLSFSPSHKFFGVFSGTFYAGFGSQNLSTWFLTMCRMCL